VEELAGDKDIELLFSPDGTLLVTMSEKTVKVWNGKTGDLITVLPGERPPVRFSFEGRFFATTGPQTSVLLWKY
jgi:WD40 repeat protein